ncbi:MAG TPA: multiheme c-type cytochrome [Ignavibacteriales bacterium]|nr:multiheme c-type cytochrome [Ignavibacteriales bacterium]
MQNKNTLLFGILSATVVFITAVVMVQITRNSRTNNHFTVIKKEPSSKGVCPPFYLYDEEGNLIDPVHNINADKPYSPRQTCGKCHDYNKITEGFHFQQGRGEKLPETMKDRFQWVSSPGNYGGNWCSPAPVYRQLARKNNRNARMIDMTSFDFITATCGSCHPGGGPLEYDRDGKRYDKTMLDSSKHYTSGADNNFDGDYFKARWTESGVIEADCMLCHLPEYDYKARNTQLDKLNFRWAASEGSGLAKVDGSIKDNKTVSVKYDTLKFDPSGKVSMHIVREPRNETCLNCHAKPDWKKRGTTFSARRDVHFAAGLKCVDCHPAGSSAFDSRVRGKENHQFGKGDDPSGNVRNDLDNTARDCKDCHLTGYLNAPVAKHSWLPPLHLEKIACQTCHIKERPIKSALVQVSDVFNPGTKISPPPKYIWTFYDQNMNYWNHYGELNMFTAKDEPTDPARPVLARYKGKIYPVNPVHSAWPGILTKGKKGLDQPSMKDIYSMWVMHNSDSLKYPLLSIIKDDNGDKIPEINKPDEIDALIQSVTLHLKNTKYDLTGKKVVWVNDDRVYTSGKEYFTVPKEDYESSPYASVYKYSHDVMPSMAALGVNGCTDCHSFGSSFFNAEVVKYPFGPDGKPVTEPQYKKLGISQLQAFTGAFREEVIKPVIYSEISLFVIVIVLSFIFSMALNSMGVKISPAKVKLILSGIYILVLLSALLIVFKEDLNSYILPNRIWLDSNHFIISIAVILLGLFKLSKLWKDVREKSVVKFMFGALSVMILLTLLCGLVILFFKLSFLSIIAYNLYDLMLAGILLTAIIVAADNQIKNITR